MKFRFWLASVLLLLPFTLVMAEGEGEDEVKVEAIDSSFIPLVKDKPYIFVIHDGKSVKVERVQDPEFQLQGYCEKIYSHHLDLLLDSGAQSLLKSPRSRCAAILLIDCLHFTKAVYFDKCEIPDSEDP